MVPTFDCFFSLADIDQLCDSSEGQHSKVSAVSSQSFNSRGDNQAKNGSLAEQKTNFIDHTHQTHHQTYNSKDSSLPDQPQTTSSYNNQSQNNHSKNNHRENNHSTGQVDHDRQNTHNSENNNNSIDHSNADFASNSFMNNTDNSENEQNIENSQNDQNNQNHQQTPPQQTTPNSNSHAQATVTLPSIMSKLDEINFPPQQLVHLGEIKETWSSLNDEISTFVETISPPLDDLISQNEQLVRKTEELVAKMPKTMSLAETAAANAEALTETAIPQAAQSARSARFRGGAAPSAASGPVTRNTPANRRLAAEWETYAKKVSDELEHFKNGLHSFHYTQNLLQNELAELGDTFDDPDTVQNTLYELKASYQQLTREYKRLQFKLQHSRSSMLANMPQNNSTRTLFAEIKDVETKNEELEKVNSVLNDEMAKIRGEVETLRITASMPKLKSTKPGDARLQFQEMQLKVLRGTIAAITEENDKLQQIARDARGRSDDAQNQLSQAQNQLVQMHNNNQVNGHMPLAPTVSKIEDVTFLEEEVQVLTSTLEDEVAEKKRLQSELIRVQKTLQNAINSGSQNQSSGLAQNNTSSPGNNQQVAELTTKLKKLKTENSRFKKDRKRQVKLAGMLTSVSLTDELKNLGQMRGINSTLLRQLEEKFDLMKEQNAVLINELKGASNSSRASTPSNTEGETSERKTGDDSYYTVL